MCIRDRAYNFRLTTIARRPRRQALHLASVRDIYDCWIIIFTRTCSLCISYHFVITSSLQAPFSPLDLPKGVPREGQRGAPASPLRDRFFWKKDQFLNKFGIFGQKKGIWPPWNFFFILPSSKISPGYALDLPLSATVRDSVPPQSAYSRFPPIKPSFSLLLYIVYPNGTKGVGFTSRKPTSY